MSAMPTDPPFTPSNNGLLADMTLRTALTRFVRGRVPAGEVEDVVQATLTEALASSSPPAEAIQLRRWVFGIAKHKCADFYRHQGREAPAAEPLDGDVPVEGEPLGARDLLRWAESELPEGEHSESTLEWMLREASGEKLEAIADEARVPAPCVRQRVARMRRHYRTRWAAQVAAIVAAVLLLLLGVALWRLLPGAKPVANEIRPEPSPSSPSIDRAVELRHRALDACENGSWKLCLEGLDEAARLDPSGEALPPVRNARRVAGDALKGRQPTEQVQPSSKESGDPAPSQKSAPQNSVAPEPRKPVLPKVPSPQQKKGPELSDKEQGPAPNSLDLAEGFGAKHRRTPPSPTAAPDNQEAVRVQSK